VFTQPLEGLQVSTVQRFPSSQLNGAPPAHVPARQVSPAVQEFPSLQLVPSGLAGFEHNPVMSQVPAS
jgi:hypothetical protein